MPQKIVNIPKNSAIIIGHAYGKPGTTNYEISPKVKQFYNLNKDNISMIIFSGDVIKTPNINKWEKFYSQFHNDLPIYIAPGNHDVGLPDSATRDVFELTKHKNQHKYKFPFWFKWKGNFFIIDDSNNLSKPLDKVLPLIRKSNKDEPIFIIRHHVLPKSLKFASNAKAIQPYMKDSEFNIEGKINAKKDITFIYGDGGAFKNLPRIACLKTHKVNHIVNGIGELTGDTVLVIHDKQIYRKEIN